MQIAVVVLVVGVCKRSVGIYRVAQAAREVAEVFRVEVVNRLDKARLFSDNRVSADLGNRARDNRGMVEPDVAGGQRRAGLRQRWQVTRQLRLLHGLRRASAGRRGAARR
jgi:hypothetical protein